MIERRLIDGELFIAVRSGKREVTMTPQDAIAAARSDMDAAKRQIASAAADRDTARSALEEAVFMDRDTTEAREQLTKAEDRVRSANTDMQRAEGQIAAIQKTIDQHRAEQLQRQHAAHLAELVQPYVQLLKECTQ